VPKRKQGVTLRTYLTVQVMDKTGCDHITAMEAVASTEIGSSEGPTLDLNEKRTWDGWKEYFDQLQAEKGEGP
jgi:hypothetical protein